ncbi:hypothetical protein [Streptomyces zagrosensis]|uniref:Uncharacterized protein n=1 Tax=Streptomyces zagrosensis TaxID=1042984 RepID=A0A7W9V3L9_9ACTN|nr:hypothetical protein [Streptomyces zagrosensis]MBB5940049.1 hypothetical protein [Streptomyces zagrosensis]
MFRRRESVPFAFVAEADHFRSNVAPPPKEPSTRGQIAGRTLIGLTVAAGFVGALLFGMPSLGAESHSTHQVPRSEAAEGH